MALVGCVSTLVLNWSIDSEDITGEVSDAADEVWDPLEPDFGVTGVGATGKSSRSIASMVPVSLPRREPIALCPPQLVKTIVWVPVSAFHTWYIHADVQIGNIVAELCFGIAREYD